MAGQNKITYVLDFKANLTNVQQQLDTLSAKLNTVAQQRVLNPNASKEILQASNAASILEMNLKKAFNADTGKLDLTKFNMEIKNSGHNLQTLSRQLLSAGKTGQEAFMQMSVAIANSQRSMIHAGSAAQKLWATLKNTARWQISSFALTGLIRGITGAIGYVKDLNKSLNSIRIVSGASADEMSRFADYANKAARRLSATTLDITNAALIYRQQGDNAELAAKKAEITTKAANISYSASAQEMSEYLTAIWNSYKVGEEQLESFVDKLAYVGANTATSMEEISTSMEKVAATANTVGVSYEQAMSQIATVSSVTRQSAETIGTAFKTIYARIGDLKIDGESVDEDGVSVTLGQVSSSLQDAGIYILDANKNIRDMGTIIEEIGGKWQYINEAQKTAIAQTIAGKRQYTQVMALFENWDMYKETLEGVAGAQGTLNEQNAIFAESWNAVVNRMKAAWQSIIMALSNDDAIIDIIDGFTSIIDKIAGIIDAMGGFKNLMLGIGIIFTRVYANNIANGLTNLAHGFMSLTPWVEKYNAAILKKQQAEIDSAAASRKISAEYQEQLSLIYRLAQATNEFNSKKKSMSGTNAFMMDFDLQVLNEQVQKATNGLNTFLETKQRIQTGNLDMSFFAGQDFSLEAAELNRINQLLKETGGNINEVGFKYHDMSADAAAALEYIESQFHENEGAIKRQRESLGDLNKKLIDFQNRMRTPTKSKFSLEKDLKVAKTRLEEINNETRVLQNTLNSVKLKDNLAINFTKTRVTVDDLRLALQQMSGSTVTLDSLRKQFISMGFSSTDAARAADQFFRQLKNGQITVEQFKQSMNGGPSFQQFRTMLVQNNGDLTKTNQAFKEAGGSSETFNLYIKQLATTLQQTQGKSLTDFIKRLKELSVQGKSTDEIIKEIEKDLNRLKDKKMGPGFAQSLTQATSALMSISMAFSQLDNMIDSIKDGTFEMSDALVTIPMLLMSIVSAFNALKIAAQNTAKAAWWLIAISAAVAAISWAWEAWDEANISLEEAQENLEKLNGEFETLSGELDEIKKKTKNVEDLGAEYLALKDKANWSQLNEDEMQRLTELSEQLTNEYDIEATSLNNLRGSYDVAKESILEYTEALRQERLEKEREIVKNRKDTIKNKIAEIEADEKNVKQDNFVRVVKGTNGRFLTYNGEFSYDDESADEVETSTKFEATERSNLWKAYAKANPEKNYNDFTADFQILSDGRVEISNTDSAMRAIETFNDEYQGGAELKERKEKVKKEIRAIMGDLIKAEAGDSVDDVGLQILNQGVNEYLEGDSESARKIMNDPETAGWYAENLGDFAKEYSGNIRDIVAADKKIKEKISSGEGLSLKNYEEYFNNIERQAGILKAKFDKGLIDADAYIAELDELKETIYQDSALTLTFIEKNFENLGSGFKDLKTDMIDLSNQFNTGKITQKEYFDSLINNLDKTKNAFGDNKKAAIEYLNSISTQGQIALNSLISSFEDGNISTNQFIDGIEDISNSFIKLAKTMESFGMGGFDAVLSNLESLKNQLNELQNIFPKLARSAKSSAATMASALESVGITTQDVKNYVSQYGDQFTETEKQAVSNAQTTQDALIASGDAYGTAQGAATEKYKTLMARLGAQIGNIISGVMNWLQSFKVTLKGNPQDGYVFEVAGGKTDIRDEDWNTFVKNNKDQYGFSGKDWMYSKGAKWYAEGRTEQDLYNEFWSKGANGEDVFTGKWGINTVEDYTKYTQGFYDAKYNNLTGLVVSISNSSYNTADSLNIDNPNYVPNPPATKVNDEGKGSKEEERKYDDELEAKIRDILDKNTKKLEKKLEQQQQYGELLDAEIDGWHNVLINQEQIVKTNEDLYKAELKNKEDLNKLLNDTLDEHGFDLPTILTWFGEDFEATEFFINLKNSKGTNDEAEVIQKIFDDYQKIFKALDETETRTQELLQSIKSSRDELLSGYENYYNYELDQLKEIQDQIKWEKEKIIDSLKDEIDLKNDLINLEKKHNDAMKELRTTQREINKNLFDSKMNVQWLDKETRELMFNQNDYYKVTSKISDIQNYLKENYIEYQNKIAELDDDELYMADLLTKEYESQVEAKKEELAILKSSLDIEKQRNALNNSLMEKNVRVFAGGRWRQVANVEEVTKAYQEYQESINETLELQTENAENAIIREQEAAVRDLESLQKMYQQQITMMDEAIEELEHEWKLSTSLVHNIREVTLKDFQDAVKTMTGTLEWASTNYNTVKSSSGVAGTFNSISGGNGNSSNIKKYNPNIDYAAIILSPDTTIEEKLLAGRRRDEKIKHEGIIDVISTNELLTQAGVLSENGLATGRKDGEGGTFRVNELGIELLATNSGQFIELNPHEKIFNNEQMNFLYDFSRRGIESTERALSSVSAYNDESISIENLTLELPNVTDTNSFVEGLKGLKEHMRNIKTIR